MKKLIALFTLVSAVSYGAVFGNLTRTNEVYTEQEADAITDPIAADVIATSNYYSDAIFGSVGDAGNLAAYGGAGLVDSGVATTNILITYDEVLPYLVDPDTVQTQITVNAEAITDLQVGAISTGEWALVSSATNYFPLTYTHLQATTNAALNGSNLWNTVTGFNDGGTTNIVIVDLGEYTLPSTLSITGNVTKIICEPNRSCGKFVASFAESSADKWEAPDEPDFIPLATINGNITITANTPGIEIVGFKTVGTISAPSSLSDITNRPPVIKNGWHIGEISAATQSAISFDGVFVDGSVVKGSGIWGGYARDSIILGDGSFYALATGSAKAATTHWQGIDSCWIAGTNSLGMNGVGSALFFRNSRINGEGAFRKVSTATGYVRAFGTEFYEQDGDGVYTNGWDGIDTADARTELAFCTGLGTNLTAPTVGTVDYCKYIDGAKSD